MSSRFAELLRLDRRMMRTNEDLCEDTWFWFSGWVDKNQDKDFDHICLDYFNAAIEVLDEQPTR